MKLFLIDDHAILRQGIRQVIEHDPEVEVVGESDGGECVVQEVTTAQPDVVLLDLDLGGRSGLKLMPQLRQMAPTVRILILTGTSGTEEHLKAMRAGALGLVLKSNATRELLPALHKVAAGEVWLDQTLLKDLLDERQRERERDPDEAKRETLTKREREIIRLVGEGLRNRQIGERLFISEGTVKQHLATIFSKLGVSDRFELIMYAYRHGLAHPPLQKGAS